MDYEVSCKVLGLDIHTLKSLDYKTLRSAYLKKSLRYHPDKNNGKDEEFKKIVAAYENLFEFLATHKRVNRSFQEENIKSSYNKILEEILNEIISLQTDSNVKGSFRWNKEFIVTTIKSLLKTFLNKSYSVFDNLDSNTCIQIYDFLIEFNDIGFIDQSYLNNLKKILQKKINNVIILEPSLNDLLSDKIYKLEMFDKTFYVPLWHNELVYSYSDENNIVVNFIVKIEPILDDKYFIDDKNDLYVKKQIKFSDLQVIFENGFLDVEFSNKNYKIPCEQIKMMKESQLFKFNDGIIRINQSDMFCSEERGCIMIEVNIIQ